jgi:hypothetical protein
MTEDVDGEVEEAGEGCVAGSCPCKLNELRPSAKDVQISRIGENAGFTSTLQANAQFEAGSFRLSELINAENAV